MQGILHVLCNLTYPAAYSKRRTCQPYGGYGNRTRFFCSSDQYPSIYLRPPVLRYHARKYLPSDWKLILQLSLNGKRDSIDYMRCRRSLSSSLRPTALLNDRTNKERLRAVCKSKDWQLVMDCEASLLREALHVTTLMTKGVYWFTAALGFRRCLCRRSRRHVGVGLDYTYVALLLLQESAMWRVTEESGGNEAQRYNLYIYMYTHRVSEETVENCFYQIFTNFNNFW